MVRNKNKIIQKITQEYISVFPVLLRLVKSPLLHLFFLVLLPLQIGAAMGAVIIFSAHRYNLYRIKIDYIFDII